MTLFDKKFAEVQVVKIGQLFSPHLFSQIEGFKDKVETIDYNSTEVILNLSKHIMYFINEYMNDTILNFDIVLDEKTVNKTFIVKNKESEELLDKIALVGGFFIDLNDGNIDLDKFEIDFFRNLFGTKSKEEIQRISNNFLLMPVNVSYINPHK